MSITEKISEIKKSIPSSVKIIAATKTRSAEEIKEAMHAGITILGENYVQEGKKRKEQFPDAEIHLIGNLQSNKVKAAVKTFDMIHTVDSISILNLINTEAEKISKVMPFLIQVNISEEKQKSGCSAEEIEKIIVASQNMHYIEYKGLMCIPSPHQVEPQFSRMQQLKIVHNAQELSMGMSDDYLLAIKHGATMVRLGTAIFGERNKKQKENI